MTTGTIKNVEKGMRYGFIRADGITGDLFFHRESLSAGVSMEDLQINQRVEFDIEDSPKGKRAERVSPL